MSNLALRPPSLLDVSRRAAAGDQEFDPALREFLDDFYSYPDRRDAAIAEEPVLLDDDIKDAYLAAVAEHLAARFAPASPGLGGTSRAAAQTRLLRRRAGVAQGDPHRRKPGCLPQKAAFRQQERARPPQALTMIAAPGAYFSSAP